MSKSLTGAEILRPGTWNGIDITADDLDDIVSNFAALQPTGRVPLKLGHNDQQPLTDGQPALGWIERVYRAGDRLLADFKDMPTLVFDAITKGLYKSVSVELFKDVKTPGGLRSWVLDAVALLGADIPAVSGLKDLQALTMSKRAGLPRAAAYAFTQERQPNGGRSTMTDQEIAELKAKLAASEARFSVREEQLAKQKIEDHRTAITRRFTDAVNEKKIEPRVRHLFINKRSFKDDERVLGISMDDVDAEIKENTIKMATDNNTGRAQVKLSKDLEDRTEGMRADGKWNYVVREHMARFGLKRDVLADVIQANTECARLYPALVKEYHDLPDQH